MKGLLISKYSNNVWNKTLNPEVLVISASEACYFNRQYLFPYMAFVGQIQRGILNAFMQAEAIKHV